MKFDRRHFLKKTGTSALAAGLGAFTTQALAQQSETRRKTNLPDQQGEPMNIKIAINEKAQNSINFHWNQWPTNIFALWIPEVWIFDHDPDRLWTNDQVGWKADGPGVATELISRTYKDYAFQWKGNIAPAKDSVDLELYVKNTGQKPLPPLFHGSGCLNFLRAPDFMDSSGAFTFIRTKKGWRDMTTVRRPQALQPGHDPIHILAEGYQTDTKDTELIDSVRSTSSLCVRVGRTSQYCVGFAWQTNLRTDINFNRLHCMHSVAAWNSLEPGKEATRKGKIYFHKGEKDDLLELCQKDGLA